MTVRSNQSIISFLANLAEVVEGMAIEEITLSWICNTYPHYASYGEDYSFTEEDVKAVKDYLWLCREKRGDAVMGFAEFGDYAGHLARYNAAGGTVAQFWNDLYRYTEGRPDPL